jgi:glycyl-tRNA synthetase
MENLYDRNGLIFWTEQEILHRNLIVQSVVSAVSQCLKEQNSAWEIIQVEAPLLTPRALINPNYSINDYYVASAKDELTLRPETTMGSYAYAQHLLNTHNQRKIRMPLCVWQHGKSFRQEQDQPTKFMRLKEFYQLEFQCIYALNTANDYSVKMIPAVQKALSLWVGPCRTEPSDRLPDYSESTTDVVCEANDMEVCSISKRKDFPNAKVLEVAVGTDRCVYNLMNRG